MPTKMLDGREVECTDEDLVQIAIDAARAAAPDPRIPVTVVRERLEAIGLWDELSALLLAQALASPAAAGLLLRVLTLREGIDPTDQQACAMITAVGADPEAILAPLPETGGAPPDPAPEAGGEGLVLAAADLPPEIAAGFTEIVA